MTKERECKELYGARDAATYEAVMARSKVCHRRATKRITIPGLATIYRCGIHARGYGGRHTTIEVTP